MDVIVVGGGPVGLMAAALLDAAGVRVEVYERGSEPSRQSRGTTMHPRTLEVLTMLDAGDGRRISDVLLAQGRRVPDTHYAGLPDLGCSEPRRCEGAAMPDGRHIGRRGASLAGPVAAGVLWRGGSS